MTHLTPEQVERVLFVARSQINVTESPPNTNKGLKVQDYQRAVGITVGKDPWCAALVYWVGTFALGAGWPLPKTGGCASLGDWATLQGVLQTSPKVGDVFLLYEPKLRRFGHTGFIEKVNADGSTLNIEGNTSGEGSREGWGVFHHTRSWKAEDRFIRVGSP